MPSAAQHFPGYRYTSDGTPTDNITDLGRKQFQKAYWVNGLLDPARLEAARQGDGAEPVAPPHP